MTCGIYLLRFNGTDKVYVGQSKNVEKRFKTHVSLMKQQKSSIQLNKAFDLYGTPTLEILCECSVEELDFNENMAIDIFNATKQGFNINDSSGFRQNISGEDAVNCTITNKQALQILDELIKEYPKTGNEIAEICGTNRNVVKDISAGISHNWMKEIAPEKYNKLLSMKGKRNNGELNSTSKYTNDQIVEIMNILVEFPDVSLMDISINCELHYNTVKSINYGINHKWLSTEYPEQYKKMQDLIKQRPSKSRDIASKGITYKVKSPDNEIFEVTSIRGFAKEHDLNQGHLGAVLRGREKQHKGWTSIPIIS